MKLVEQSMYFEVQEYLFNDEMKLSITRIKPRLIALISNFNKQNSANLSTGYIPCDASVPVSRAPFQ